MKRFWGKPKNEMMQRRVFIVRAICPEWMIGNNSEYAQKTAKEQEEMGTEVKVVLVPLDIREDIDYLLNNLGLQMPSGKVRIVSDGSQYNGSTILAIREKFSGQQPETYEPPVLAEMFLPPTSLKLSKWLKRFLTAWQNTDGSIVVVVNQGTFDRWYSQINMQENPRKEPCILMSSGSQGLLSVA